MVPHNLIRSKFTEQRLSVVQIASVETLGETAVDFGEHRVRFVASTLQNALSGGGIVVTSGAEPQAPLDELSNEIDWLNKESALGLKPDTVAPPYEIATASRERIEHHFSAVSRGCVRGSGVRRKTDNGANINLLLCAGWAIR